MIRIPVPFGCSLILGGLVLIGFGISLVARTGSASGWVVGIVPVALGLAVLALGLWLRARRNTSW